MDDIVFPADIEESFRVALSEALGMRWIVSADSMIPDIGHGILARIPGSSGGQWDKTVLIHTVAAAATRREAWNLGARIERFMLNSLSAGSLYIDSAEAEFDSEVELVVKSPAKFIVDAQWRVTIRAVDAQA